MFGDKLKLAQDRITALTVLLAGAGIKIEGDTLPSISAVQAQVTEQQNSAVMAALAPAQALMVCAQNEAGALKAGLGAAGVKLGDFKAEDFAIGEGKTIAECPASMAIKTAVEATVTMAAAKQVAGSGHPAAIEVPTAAATPSGDATPAEPASAEEFLASLNAITDPAKRTAFYRKYQAKFPAR
jgi:hypothetical protein